MSNDTPLPTFVIDTVGLVLHLEKRKLKPASKDILHQAESGQATIFIPAMVFAEILYLSERERISVSLKDVVDYVNKQRGFVEYPRDANVINAAQQITDIPELHDRLIAATAKVAGTKLITNDLKIETSTFVQTIW
jgi:predicted nucleic acid-binding protein